MRWERGPGSVGNNSKPALVIAWRGSKCWRDWAFTNAKMLTAWSPLRKVVPLSELSELDRVCVKEGRGTDSDAGKVRHVRWCNLESDDEPFVPISVWHAYAGRVGEKVGSADGGMVRRKEDTPRFLVRQAVYEALKAEPDLQVVVTGHSLGGALAQLCAYDLLVNPLPVPVSADVQQPKPLILCPFASPAVFNVPFQKAMRAFQERDTVSGTSRLHALLVTSKGDFACRTYPGSRCNGITKRLVLSPPSNGEDDYQAYFVNDDEDDRCRDLGLRAGAGIDPFAHNMYSKQLSGMRTKARPHTLRKDAPWPVELTGGSRRRRQKPEPARATAKLTWVDVI